MSEQRLSVRIPIGRFPHLKARLRKAAQLANVDESVLVLAAVDGVCTYIEQAGAVSFPVQMIAPIGGRRRKK